VDLMHDKHYFGFHRGMLGVKKKHVSRSVQIHKIQIFYTIAKHHGIK